jgi:hypothetical protein
MNEESAWAQWGKNFIGRKNSLSYLSVCDMLRVVSLVINNLSVRVCESREKLFYLKLLLIYPLSRSSSNNFTLWLSILSILFPHWTMIVPFVWTDVMSQCFLGHLDSALRRIPSFLSSTFCARHIHRGIIKVLTVSTLCYTHLQVAWQTEGQRHSTTQLPCITRNITHMSIYISW